MRRNRIRKIHNLLDRQSSARGARVVLLYGKARDIADTPLTEHRKTPKYRKQGKTWFVSTNHVTGRGSLTKKEYHQLGQFLSKKIASD